MMPSLTERLAAFLKGRPHQWVDGRELARVGGYAAYRTRISDLRRPPFNLSISNRQRRVMTDRGERVTVSEYRLDAQAPDADPSSMGSGGLA